MQQTSSGIRGFAFSSLTMILLIGALFAPAGCKTRTQPAPQPEEPPPFAWDDAHPTPQSRLASPIQWHATGERQAVLAEARSSGKAVLCYVSRYDSDLTGTLEGGLFVEDMWGRKIADEFVAWEIDWWQDPSTAQMLLGDDPPPAIFVLIPSPDATSDELGVLDSWAGNQLLSFPLHQEVLPLQNPAATERILSFREARWDEIPSRTIPRAEVDADEFAKGRLNALKAELREGSGLYPDEILFVAVTLADEAGIMEQLKARAASWRPYLGESSEQVVWMPDDAFVPRSGWAVDLIRNLEAIAAAVDLGVEWPANPASVLGGLRGMIVLESGGLGGGFPAYLDIRGTFGTGSVYLNDESRPTADVWLRLGDPMYGPRDIVWVNARMVSWLLRIGDMDAEVAGTEISPGITVGDFADSSIPNVVFELLARAGDPRDMSFQDRVYLLDLLNEAYQRTADVALLEKAGDIAATFDPERAEEWFDPRMMPMLPDLAVALHQYGWLAEDEKPRQSADYITEHAAAYAAAFPESLGTRLAFAHEVVHSKCIHVGVVASIGDEAGKALLGASMLGWDPRIVAQILDPERDKELIEKKGYGAMEQAAAYICVDDICFMPSFEPADVIETIREARRNVTSERAGEQ